MGYKLGTKSLLKLSTVDDKLQDVVKRAIEISKCDFSVTDGLRTAEQQHALYKKGASTKDGYNKKSMHQSGLAVDLVPYIDGKLKWDVDACITIAEAVREAAEELGCTIRWGGTWTVITGTTEAVSELVKANPTRFFDGPHYELRK